MAQASHRFRGHVHEGKPKARGNVGRDAAEIRRMALAGAAFFDVAMVQGTCLRNPIFGRINFLLQSPLYWGYPSISVKVEIS